MHYDYDYDKIQNRSFSQNIFCRFDGWGKHDCERTEAAGVICKPMPPTTTPPPPTTTPRPKIEIHKTHGHYLKARLSGGRDLNEGTYHGENLICSLTTMDQNEFSKSIYKSKFFHAGIFFFFYLPHFSVMIFRIINKSENIFVSFRNKITFDF